MCGYICMYVHGIRIYMYGRVYILYICMGVYESICVCARLYKHTDLAVDVRYGIIRFEGESVGKLQLGAVGIEVGSFHDKRRFGVIEHLGILRVGHSNLVPFLISANLRHHDTGRQRVVIVEVSKGDWAAARVDSHEP